jgi:SAM-dependent methyltransferase
MIESHYALWQDEKLRREFQAKTPSSFFETERRFVAPRIDGINSVLDIGCASGRFIELLSSMGWNGRFTGVDVVEDNITTARNIYPQHRFLAGNAVDMNLNEKFDLVNATGVMQHEPRFEALVQTMLNHSARYVMFDVKFGPMNEHLADVEQSYCQIGDAKAFFICLSYQKFLEFLRSLHGIRQIGIFGYYTGFNKTTVVPSWLTRWVSAGIFLEKGEGPLEVNAELPDEISGPRS